MKNLIIVIVGVIAAAIISFIIISLGHFIIPPPIEMDTNDFESIRNNFHLLELRHFIFPLLAHAISTFCASYLVSRYTDRHKFWFALSIGVLFTILSLSLSLRLGHMNWIGIVEIGHYIPMSILGFKLWQRTSV